jgi:endoglucanase
MKLFALAFLPAIAILALASCSQLLVDIIGNDVSESEPQNLVAPTSKGLYVDPNSSPVVWVRNNPTDGRAANIRDNITKKSTARWFVGGSNSGVKSAVNDFVSAATTAQKTAVLVAYNIPGRDCGQFSSGGAKDADAYKSWVSSLAQGIGARNAIVILEPDALPLVSGCASNETAVIDLIKGAVTEIKTKAQFSKVYIDAGNSNWKSVDDIAQLLNDAGVSGANGFSLNVSNYRSDSELKGYGEKVSAKVGGKPFVIDSSRNGNGPAANNEFCNPDGRKIGAKPGFTSSEGKLQYRLWIKVPGESDGDCRGNKPAGQFDPKLAYRLTL